MRSRASSSDSVAISSSPRVFAAVRETPVASAARTSATTPCVEHRLGARDDPPLELVGRDLEPDDHGRVPGRARPEAIVVGHERRARLRELERADEAPLVVRVDGLGCARIEAGEPRVRRSRIALDLGQDPLTHARAGRRRHVQVGERGAKVEPRAAADDRGPGACDELVDRCVRERRVGADRHLLARGRGSRRARSAGSAGWSGSAGRGTPAWRRRRRPRCRAGRQPPRPPRSSPTRSGRRRRSRRPSLRPVRRERRWRRSRAASSRSIPRSPRRRGRLPAPSP